MFFWIFHCIFPGTGFLGPRFVYDYGADPYQDSHLSGSPNNLHIKPGRDPVYCQEGCMDLENIILEVHCNKTRAKNRTLNSLAERTAFYAVVRCANGEGGFQIK